MHSANLVPMAGQSSGAADMFKLITDIDIGEVHNIQSQTLLALVSSLAFLLPAVGCWRMARLWHAWLFGMMAVICCSFHFCAAGDAEHLGTCAPATTQTLQRLYRTWICVCFLQMALVVFGPEDPQLQQLAVADKSTWRYISSGVAAAVPWDVIILARFLPMVLFVACNQLMDSENIYWQNMLLAEMMLVFSSSAFWLHPRRRNYAADVLLRFKFWHRLLHKGLIPAIMLFWIFCIMSFADQKALYAMLNLIMSAFAMGMLPSSSQASGTGTGAGGFDTEVLDSSAQNPNVAHILMGSVALIVVPTAVVGASYDWCSGAPWLLISSVMECQPGGYFVAIVAVPTFTAVAVIFWIIDSTAPSTKSPWSKQRPKPWEERHRSDKIPDLPCDGSGVVLRSQETLGPRQRTVGKHWGCMLGYTGAAFGLASSLVMKGTPVQNGMNLLFSLISLGALTIAGSLTVLCSDPAVPGYPLRLHFTVFICMPLIAVYILLMLSSKSIDHDVTVPGSEGYATVLLHAMSEYVTLIALVLWPLTWAAEVLQDVQRKESGSFAWPITSWRFD